MSGAGFNDEHTSGRSGCPKIKHRLSADNCTHRTPAGLLIPFIFGMPGIGDEIDGAMQHAPQPGRQFIRGPVSAATLQWSTGWPMRACNR